jgi:hypothetical protein
MDLTAIRRMVISALFSDELLMDLLVLKGGNAVSLVYGFGSRSSIDVDLSIEGDFGDTTEVKRRIVSSVRERFLRSGYVVFDEIFENRPGSRAGNTEDIWGGYEFRFKVISRNNSQFLSSDRDKARRLAEVVSPDQVKTFKVQISRFEYCRGKGQAEVDAATIYVYTPAMLVLEKMRALCQQMPEYPLVRWKRPRARDFYDIHAIVTESVLNLGTSENLELARNIFAVKEVPLHLLSKLDECREFHQGDWDAVRDSVAGYLNEFDFYFDFVVNQAQLLEPLWVE